MDKINHVKRSLKLNESDKKTLLAYQNFIIDAPKKELAEPKMAKGTLVKIS